MLIIKLIEIEPNCKVSKKKKIIIKNKKNQQLQGFINLLINFPYLKIILFKIPLMSQFSKTMGILVRELAMTVK